MSRKELYFNRDGSSTGLLEFARKVKSAFYMENPDLAQNENAEELAKAEVAQHLPDGFRYRTSRFTTEELKGLPLITADTEKFQTNLRVLIEMAGGTNNLINTHTELYVETNNEEKYLLGYTVEELRIQADLQHRKSLEQIVLEPDGLKNLIDNIPTFDKELFKEQAESSKTELLDRLNNKRRLF